MSEKWVHFNFLSLHEISLLGEFEHTVSQEVLKANERRFLHLGRSVTTIAKCRGHLSAFFFFK